MIEMLDKIPLKGIFVIAVYRKGVLVEEFKEHNLIVNSARDQVAHLIAGDAAGRSIAKIAFGTNSNGPEAADTMITNVYARPVTGFEFPAMGKVQVNWELPITEGNGMAISEFGLLTADGTLFARITRKKPIHKELDISIDGHWTIEI